MRMKGKGCSSRPRKRGTKPRNSKTRTQTDASGRAVPGGQPRAAVPTSALLYLLAFCDLSDGPPCLVDGLIGVSVSTRVRIRDGNAAVWLARHFAGSFTAFQPEGIEQRVVLIGIAVRPAIDCDGGDVTGRIKSSGTENAS